MHIVESHLQSKISSLPDHGGEDRIIVTDNFAAVIDGATAKTDSRYEWQGQQATPGVIAAEILAQGITELDAAMNGKEACSFLNDKIYQAYQNYGILDKVKNNPAERFTAVMALFNVNQNYVVLAGDVQVIIGQHHYQMPMLVDELNSKARSDEVKRLIALGELTEEQLFKMNPQDDPSRVLLMNPPAGSTFPGLKGQSAFQNNPNSPYGFFTLDGFANFAVPGFAVIDVPKATEHIILASDGYIVLEGQNASNQLVTLEQAEKNLSFVLKEDPSLYRLYKATKGKGSNHSFDDRAYLKLKI